MRFGTRAFRSIQKSQRGPIGFQLKFDVIFVQWETARWNHAGRWISLSRHHIWTGIFLLLVENNDVVTMWGRYSPFISMI
ncbi:hypothetical protein L484_027522 [Morus notabilis]|uniref:Uncharacterized protein n=1 Tax=Morus notabilis TaxID=981085 RepID=W9RYB4_9ROSA|nr:hypothetical protein L484_027522 [Morus notabilis]